MKKSRCRESQIIQILKETEAGVPVPDLCRKHGMSNASFYKWRSKYGGIDVSNMKRLKELEQKNSRLKKMYAEEKLKAEIISEALEKKVVKPSRRKAMAQRAVTEKSVSIRLACRHNASHGLWTRSLNIVRHEWLDDHLFESVAHAQQTATDWLWRYNNERPNMANGGITPIQELKLAA